jgi:hypothetical protein
MLVIIGITTGFTEVNGGSTVQATTGFVVVDGRWKLSSGGTDGGLVLEDLYAT